MAYIFNYLVVHWKDDGNRAAQSFLIPQDQASGGEVAYLSLVAAMQDCCDAGIQAIQMTTTTIIGTEPTDGPYKTVWDRAVMLDKIASTNRSARQSLVGPKAEIFLPDTRIVDLSNDKIVTLQGEVTSLLGDRLGNACGPFKRGTRQNAEGS